MKQMIFVLATLLTGCATALTPAGSGVRLMKADPPDACTEIGGVSAYGNGAGGGAIDDAKTRLRNNAAEQGANYVRLETVNEQSATINGTAYRCPTAEKVANSH